MPLRVNLTGVDVTAMSEVLFPFDVEFYGNMPPGLLDPAGWIVTGSPGSRTLRDPSGQKYAEEIGNLEAPSTPGSFNGGVIHHTLTVDTLGVDEPSVKIGESTEPPSDASHSQLFTDGGVLKAKLPNDSVVQVGNGGSVPSLADVIAEDGDPSGQQITGELVVLLPSPGIGLQIADAGGNELIQLSSSAGLLLSGDPSQIKVQDDGHNTVLFLTKDEMIFGHHAAPADGDLDHSTFTLWLDATPGATKLMIKAKDSGGTVRTGSVNLT
jgi:hypothetical protein